MSEGKETNFFDKLKKDKKTRFEFIMAIWSGIIGVALVIGLFFVGKTFFFGKKVVDSGDLEDKPAVVTEQAVVPERPRHHMILRLSVEMKKIFRMTRKTRMMI